MPFSVPFLNAAIGCWTMVAAAAVVVAVKFQRDNWAAMVGLNGAHTSDRLSTGHVYLAERWWDNKGFRMDFDRSVLYKMNSKIL